METILAYPIPIFSMLIAACGLHVLEHKLSKKTVFLILNIALHVGIVVFLLLVGASLEELLLILLISLTVAML